jgi:two-component system, chemotaxis family, sensor kinase Cph1
VVCHDLTERKQVEEKLQQFNRELERQVQTRTLLLKQALAQEKQLNLLRSCIVSTISHEYRTPLAIIQSSAEILERYYPKLTHEKILAHCQRVQASTKQLDHLVSQMLMVGQAQSTDLKCYRDAVDLKDFCCRVIDEMNAAAPSVTIAFTQQGHHTIAHLDETLLHHILTNLLSNAIKYSDPNSIVELELTCTEQAASFSLSDTGIGIPQAEISQLFEYFYRASNVGTRPGIGLGLAIVKQCVDLHGGTIVIDSAEGLGTKVTVKLPFGKFSMT